VRIHLAGEHALELQLLHVLLEQPEVALDGARGGFVVLLDGEAEQLVGVLQTVAEAIERAYDLLEASALAPQLLRLVGRIPDGGVLQLAADLGEPLALEVVLKETSGAARCARSGHRGCGGSDWFP
jgi:hypothetical protein